MQGLRGSRQIKGQLRVSNTGKDLNLSALYQKAMSVMKNKYQVLKKLMRR